MNKRILIITTGGTIAMKMNSDIGIVPNDEFIDRLKEFPQMRNLAHIEIYEFANIPSPHMDPAKMMELAKVVEQKIIEFDGIVITHGTDTLEETAYMLDLILVTPKPVVFTAAMRSNSELGLDGPRNIVGAVRVAADDKSCNNGVLVVMNDEIDAARDVVKTDSGKTDSFVTPSYGILGNVDPDKVVFYRNTILKEKIPTVKIEENVDLIKCTSGMDGRFIKASIKYKAKAIVLEAFGRGNVTLKMIPAIKEAVEKGIIVVIVSRTYTGRVLAEYGYEGGGKELQSFGVIMGGDLKGLKMRIKLMVLLGKYNDPKIVREYLKNN
ncbi:MAG: asparaginase [Candidatus Cloacimonetes bacterium]|nr:asparaginase [Candidatus Cloacimonadota bacterium]